MDPFWGRPPGDDAVSAGCHYRFRPDSPDTLAHRPTLERRHRLVSTSPTCARAQLLTTGNLALVPAHSVRKAGRSDISALAATLTHAFDDDPLTTWLFPEDNARRRKLPRFFGSLLRASLPFGEVYTADDQRCAAIWNPPGTFPMGWRTDARMGLVTASLIGPRIATCARGLLYFASHHPKERHWYLQMLGTTPDWQGHGAGSAIMAPVLDRCDREGERIYLESSKKSNIPFYERHGFVTTDEIQVHRGPVVWAMWRDPR